MEEQFKNQCSLKILRFFHLEIFHAPLDLGDARITCISIIIDLKSLTAGRQNVLSHLHVRKGSSSHVRTGQTKQRKMKNCIYEGNKWCEAIKDELNRGQMQKLISMVLRNEAEIDFFRILVKMLALLIGSWTFYHN